MQRRPAPAHSSTQIRTTSSEVPSSSTAVLDELTTEISGSPRFTKRQPSDTAATNATAQYTDPDAVPAATSNATLTDIFQSLESLTTLVSAQQEAIAVLQAQVKDLRSRFWQREAFLLADWQDKLVDVQELKAWRREVIKAEGRKGRGSVASSAAEDVRREERLGMQASGRLCSISKREMKKRR